MELQECLRTLRAKEAQLSEIKQAIRTLTDDISKFAPVKPGWIIENSIVRIKVSHIEYVEGDATCPAHWHVSGTALTKTNDVSKRHSGFHSITVTNLDNPRNSVKIIKGDE